jgi:2-dehydropantoate 2-reductase
LRILCFGAGAIGTYIGGSLILSGHQVTFLEKPDMIVHLLENGLKITISTHEYKIAHPELIADIDQLLLQAPYDIGVFALKSYDTTAAINQLLPVKHSLPPILCLQNGVENELLLRQAFGDNNVIAGTITSAVARRGIGDVKLEKLRGVGIVSDHALSLPLVNAMNAAGLNAQLFSNADEMKWSKMLTNLLANASSAILELTPSQIFADPKLCELEVKQLRETLHVMKTLQYRVVNLPATPVKLLAYSAQFLPLWISRPFLKRAVGKGRGNKMPSFYIDLQSKRGANEVSYLNGAVVRFGEKLGVPTPVNRHFTAILEGLTSGKIPRSFFAGCPDQLIASIMSGTEY